MWISDLTSHRLRDVSEHRERRLSYVHAVKLNHMFFQENEILLQACLHSSQQAGNQARIAILPEWKGLLPGNGALSRSEYAGASPSSSQWPSSLQTAYVGSQHTSAS